MAELTVLSWNVQNLFRPSSPNGAPAYEAKLAGLAAVINETDPDVLALQEVGPPEVLGDLNEVCAREFEHRLTGLADRRGIRVALMSPRRLSNRRDVSEFPEGLPAVQVRDPDATDDTVSINTSVMGRGALHATVRSGGERVHLVVVHLKSKLLSYPPRAGSTDTRFAPRDEGERVRYGTYALNRRTAEAATVRSFVTELLTTADEPDGAGGRVPVIVCGDFNDEPDAATTQLLHGPGGSEIEFRPGAGFSRPDRGDGQRLTNLAPLLAPGTGTRVYRGRAELLDQVLATNRIVNPTNLPSIEVVPAGRLPSITDDPSASTAEVSDHAAVIATFEI